MHDSLADPSQFTKHFLFYSSFKVLRWNHWPNPFLCLSYPLHPIQLLLISPSAQLFLLTGAFQEITDFAVLCKAFILSDPAVAWAFSRRFSFLCITLKKELEVFYRLACSRAGFERSSPLAVWTANNPTIILLQLTHTLHSN